MKSTTNRHPIETVARLLGSLMLTALVISGAMLVSFAVSPIGPLQDDPRAAVIGMFSSIRSMRDHGQGIDEGRPGRGELPAIPGEADGVVPDGVTVFDDEYPAVANLAPDLLGALRDAAVDAREDGIEFYVSSGWRSPEYQEHLLEEAVSTYGSEEEAAKWVASPETSAHVSGDAVDIGPEEAMAWLDQHGERYGLCRIYRNEPWHFELRPEAIEQGCPAMYDDPTQDPRTQP